MYVFHSTRLAQSATSVRQCPASPRQPHACPRAAALYIYNAAALYIYAAALYIQQIQQIRICRPALLHVWQEYMA